MTSGNGDGQGGTKGPARRTARRRYPSLILVVIVTGGLALIGAGRLFLFASHTSRNDQASSIDVPDPFHDGAPGLPSLPVQPAAAVGEDPGADDGQVGSLGSDDSTEPGDQPPKVRLDHRAVSELIDLARTTPDRWLKADIVDELASRREKASIPTIAGLLHDPDRDVRRVAANALAELDAEDQVPAMRAALATETDGAIRVAFQEALHELGHVSAQ